MSRPVQARYRCRMWVGVGCGGHSVCSSPLSTAIDCPTGAVWRGWAVGAGWTTARCRRPARTSPAFSGPTLFGAAASSDVSFRVVLLKDGGMRSAPGRGPRSPRALGRDLPTSTPALDAAEHQRMTAESNVAFKRTCDVATVNRAWPCTPDRCASQGDGRRRRAPVICGLWSV